MSKAIPLRDCHDQPDKHDDEAAEALAHGAAKNNGKEAAAANTEQQQPQEPELTLLEPHSAAAEAQAQTSPDQYEKMHEVHKKMHPKTQKKPLPKQRPIAFQSYNKGIKLDVLPPVQKKKPSFQRFLDATEPQAEDFSGKHLMPVRKKNTR